MLSDIKLYIVMGQSLYHSRLKCSIARSSSSVIVSQKRIPHKVITIIGFNVNPLLVRQILDSCHRAKHCLFEDMEADGIYGKYLDVTHIGLAL